MEAVSELGKAESLKKKDASRDSRGAEGMRGPGAGVGGGAAGGSGPSAGRWSPIPPLPLPLLPAKKKDVDPIA